MLLVGAGCSSTTPLVYVSDKDGFSATLPSAPQIEDRGAQGRTYRAASQDKKIIYLVSSAPIPKEALPLSNDTLIQAYYSYIINTAIKSYGGSLADTSATKIDGMDALRFDAEVQIENSKRYIRGAVVNRNSWTYLLYATYSEETEARKQNAEAFISSFRF